MFPSRVFRACSEAVGSVQAIYTIFRHVFAQMGDFMQVLNLLDELQAYILLLCLKLRVTYIYVGKAIQQLPDPRQLA
eukprot:7732395-Ditylum_brightwellii.AAC.1